MSYWEHVNVKLGGKDLFDFIEKNNLDRALRMIVIGAKRVDDRTGIAMELYEASDGRYVDVYLWARFLPPWCAFSYSTEIRSLLAVNNVNETYGIGLRVVTSQTPTRKIDPMFKEYKPDALEGEQKLSFVTPNIPAVLTELERQGYPRSQVSIQGFQPDNGMIRVIDSEGVHHTLVLPRRCYNVVVGKRPSRAKSDFQDFSEAANCV